MGPTVRVSECPSDIWRTLAADQSTLLQTLSLSQSRYWEVVSQLLLRRNRPGPGGTIHGLVLGLHVWQVARLAFDLSQGLSDTCTIWHGGCKGPFERFCLKNGMSTISKMGVHSLFPGQQTLLASKAEAERAFFIGRKGGGWWYPYLSVRTTASK